MIIPRRTFLTGVATTVGGLLLPEKRAKAFGMPFFGEAFTVAGGGGGLTISGPAPSAYNNTQGKQITTTTANSGDLLVAWCLNGTPASSTFTPSAPGLTFTERAASGTFIHTATATGNHTVTFTSSQPSWGDTYICGVLVFAGHGGVGNITSAGGWNQPLASLTTTAGSAVVITAGAADGGTITGWVGSGTPTQLTLQRTSTLGAGYHSDVAGSTDNFGVSMSAAASMDVLAVEILAA